MSESRGADPQFGAAVKQLTGRTVRELLALKRPGACAALADDSVLSALRFMAEKQVGLLIVLEGTRMVGVISERDHARKVTLQGRSAGNTLVRDVMTRNVVHVSPEQTVAHCLSLMEHKGLRHLPVVEDGLVIGVLSQRELQRELIAHQARLIDMMALDHPRVPRLVACR